VRRPGTTPARTIAIDQPPALVRAPRYRSSAPETAKTALVAGIDAVLYEDLQRRIERFDTAAVSGYADTVTARERAGKPISTADAQIAAICASRGAIPATRDVEDFAGTGIEIVDTGAR